MTYAFDLFERQCKDALTATGLLGDSPITLAEPKPNIPADLAFPAFVAARAVGAGNPAEFAKRIAAAVQVPQESLIGAVEAVGPFVNFRVAPDRFANVVMAEVARDGDAYGAGEADTSHTVIVEFSSPNIARKMHVGHLRSTVIGNALRKILEKNGYRVITDNHLGDWGTQFGSLLAAKEIWGWPPEMETEPIQALVEIYARFHKAAEADPALRDLAREWFRRLEAGDAGARETWQFIIDISLKEFARTYRRLGVTFDTTHGESFYEPYLADVVREALEKGVAKEEDGGAISVDFGEKLPSYLIRRSDGATLYQTRDIATCLYRWREYAPDRNIYVVGDTQSLHFQQVFETVRRMGYEEIANRSIHIPFGLVTDAAGEKFSMRRGTAIFLEEVLDEAVARARQTITDKIAEGRTELSPEEIDTASEVIGLGAVIYNDLHQGPERGIRFDWDEMLSFDGNSAPYIQYTYARCRSILRKAAASAPSQQAEGLDGASLLTEPAEQATLKQIARYPAVLRHAGAQLSPISVSEWTYGLARAFTRFYHDLPVLEAGSDALRSARLALVSATAQGLKNGLTILGIGVLDRM